MFTHLRVYSEYSLLQSACRIRPLVKRAKELGFKALALTDKNVMYGTIPFFQTCRTFNVKPIIGLEAQVVTSGAGNGKSYPLILLARNERGYRNLLKISSHIKKQTTTKEQAIDVHSLKQYNAGLIALSAGLEGEIGRCLLHGEFEQAVHLARLFKKVFDSDCFFLEVSHHGLHEETAIYDSLLRLAKVTELPFAATNGVLYVNQEDALTYEALVAIKEGRELRPIRNREYYLKSEQEMTAAIPEAFQHAITNTAKIAERCNLNLTLGKPILPKFPLPKDVSSKEALLTLAKKGMEQRYGRVEKKIAERLQYELTVIDKMGFNDYFLIVWDMMKFAREQGIIAGPARGSAAGSLVAYVLYITNVDPIEHGLLFERFLNPERVTMPDIDIDFPDTRRDEVFAYIGRKYGYEHVGHIITFGTLAARAAVRDVGRVLGFSRAEIDKLARQIPTKPGITLDEALRQSQPLIKQIKEAPKIKQLFDIARAIEGFPRHTSTHAAGIVISSRPLTDVTAVQNGHDEIALTQFPMEDLETIGLLKIDLLGLRNLSLLEAILKNIEKSYAKKLQLTKIPLSDRKTFELLSKGDTTGIFQLESSGMRQVLRKLRPSEFEDIVAVNALYRPGPMNNIPTYIAAKHGNRKITYPHPDLAPILEKTYGVIVYQEQIMQIASTMAGFTLSEADLLRRAISKKQRDILEKERSHFISGSLKNGYSEETANAVYKLLVRFADYGFNRSHAVAYSLIAYQLAYLKTHYPVAFFTSLLSSVVSNSDKLSAYISELKERRINILPPSINESEILFQHEADNIRFGLLAIKNVGLQAVKEIVLERRKSGPYKNLFDLCRRVSMRTVTRRTLEALIMAGACDCFHRNRASLLATLERAIELGLEREQGDLFDDEENEEHRYVDVPPFTKSERLAYEKEVLGFYVSGHPLDQYLPLKTNQQLYTVASLKEIDKKREVKVAIFVEDVRTIRTKNGELMAFLRVSDQTGNAEVVVFPKSYKQFKSHLQADACLFVEGSIDESSTYSDMKLVANRMTPLELRQAPKVYLKLNEESQKHETLASIKNVLLAYPGSSEVVLYYETKKQAKHLSSRFSVDPSNECVQQLIAIVGEDNIAIR